MRLTIEQFEAVNMAVVVLTELIYSADTNPMERAYLSETRAKLEAVRLMPVGVREAV